MDLISHFVTGAAIGELTMRRYAGKRALYAGGLVALLPDIDAVANLFYDPATAAYLHRGITHSFFFAIVISPLLAWLFGKWFRTNRAPFFHAAHFYFLVLLSHIALDLFTTYGIGLFEPFSHKRYTTNNIFVADPLYTLPLLITFIALAVLKNDNRLRSRILFIGAGLSMLYMAFTFINKYYVHQVIRQNLQEQNISYKNFMTTPAPLNNFLWYAVVKSDRGCYTGYYSILDKSKKVEFDYVPKNELIITLFQDNELIPVLKKFSKGYYCFTKKGKQVYFNDLRFGRAAGWAVKDSRWVFSYNITNQPKGVEVLNRRDMEISFSEAFRSLVKRAKGKD
jgi:inner membrane protein